MFFELMTLSDVCCGKALEYYRKGDLNMVLFYKNASNEFKRRAYEAEN